MNLEKVEQLCLDYLMQASRPLVPLDVLWAHLKEAPACADLSKQDLLGFLREHELFLVLDPPGAALDPNSSAALEQLGLSAGPQVVLSTRVPSPPELARMIKRQIDTMIEALETAYREAEQKGQARRAAKIQILVDKANRLRKKLRRIQ